MMADWKCVSRCGKFSGAARSAGILLNPLGLEISADQRQGTGRHGLFNIAQSAALC